MLMMINKITIAVLITITIKTNNWNGPGSTVQHLLNK